MVETCVIYHWKDLWSAVWHWFGVYVVFLRGEQYCIFESLSSVEVSSFVSAYWEVLLKYSAFKTQTNTQNKPVWNNS